MSVTLPVAVRRATDADAPAIYDNWLRCMAEELLIPVPLVRGYVRDQTPTIRRIVERSHVWVATPRTNAAIVLGWACVELPDILHFVYVKRPHRQGKVATQLLKHSGLSVICRTSYATRRGMRRLSSLFLSLTHDPTLAETT